MRPMATALARVRLRRAHVLAGLGRHEAALEDLRRAVAAFRAGGDRLWEARALSNRSEIHVARGSLARAERDARSAETLFRAAGQELEATYALHNCGIVTYCQGDIPGALAIFDEADRRYTDLGCQRTRAGLRPLPGPAGGRPDPGGGQHRRRGAGARHRDTRATCRADVRRRHRVPRRRRPSSRPCPRPARLGGCSVSRAATGGRRGQTWSRSRRGCCAVTGVPSFPGWRGSWPTGSSTLRADEAPLALVLAGRLTGTGRADRTRRPLRCGGPVPAANLGAGARHRVARPGARPRDRRRLPWRLLRLRSRARCAGRAPGNPGQLRAAGTGHRTRAGPCVARRTPGDPLGRAATTARVERAVARHDPGRAPGPSAQGQRPGRTARCAPLTCAAGSTRHASRTTRRPPSGSVGPGNARSGTSGTCSRAPDAAPRRSWTLRGLVDELADTTLARAGRGRRRAAPADRPRRSGAGEVDRTRRRGGAGGGGGEVRAASERARAADQRGGRGRAAAGRAARRCRPGDGPVVVAPPSRLHAAPWGLMPALADRSVSVVPSALMWQRARSRAPAADGRTVLIAGPGLGTGGAEVDVLARTIPGATLLRDGAATVEASLAALDGAALAHVAAHGDFRPDSPMFSSLVLDDGPLTVHDLELLDQAPHRLVLSACDSGVSVPVGADELLGLTSALLSLGTAGVLASVAEVNDEATVPFMLDVHRALGVGRRPARGPARGAQEGCGGRPGRGHRGGVRRARRVSLSSADPSQMVARAALTVETRRRHLRRVGALGGAICDGRRSTCRGVRPGNPAQPWDVFRDVGLFTPAGSCWRASLG